MATAAGNTAPSSPETAARTPAGARRGRPAGSSASSSGWLQRYSRTSAPQDLDGSTVADRRAGASRPGRLVPAELLQGMVGGGDRREVHPVPQQPLGTLLLPDQRELLPEGGRAAELAQAGTGQRVGDRFGQREGERGLMTAGADRPDPPTAPEHVGSAHGDGGGAGGGHLLAHLGRDPVR